MIKIKLFGKEFISWGNEVNKSESLAPQIIPSTPVVLPAGRVSTPSSVDDQSWSLGTGDANSKIIKPHFDMGLIPVIRQLAYSNPNLSQALNNIVELGNTGHDIKFDDDVKPEQLKQMRLHLENKSKNWCESVSNMDGLVNKMISQIIVSGALSNEWVPDNSLKGIKTVALVNPETIKWSYNTITQTYEPYQEVKNTVIQSDGSLNLVKLNTNTYKYYTLNGDSDHPYGIPPYLTAIDSIKTQKLMMDNIKFIVEQVGVLGFLEVTMQKPDRIGGESEIDYSKRLEKFLQDARKRVQEGYRDGITVGYADDTEFKFNSASRNFAGVNELFQLNELLMASGLKQDASMLGRNYGTSETQITVIFTKLLSQLKNIQNLVAANLEYGYSLELRLAGFKFKNLKVTFKPSTATDELKYQQAQEIKIRNLNGLYLDGIISMLQYAHEMGYETPDEDKPRFIRGNVQSEAEINQKREADKNASDRKGREKKKPLSAIAICPNCGSHTPNIEAGMGYLKCIHCEKTFSSTK